MTYNDEMKNKKTHEIMRSNEKKGSEILKILIDGDGCPVTELVIQLAKPYQIPVLLICDTAHVCHREDIPIIMVNKGRDATDFELMRHVQKGDVIITQDYGLAAMGLTKQAYVMHQNGMQYTTQNIDQLLFSRHLSQKIRNSGKRVKGPSKRTRNDDLAFKTSFEALLVSLTLTK